jgi:hypothetical protein
MATGRQARSNDQQEIADFGGMSDKPENYLLAWVQFYRDRDVRPGYLVDVTLLLGSPSRRGLGPVLPGTVGNLRLVNIGGRSVFTGHTSIHIQDFVGSITFVLAV